MRKERSKLNFSFLKKKKKAESLSLPTNIERFEPDINEGLSSDQVNKRITENLLNKTTTKNEKTYLKIFCTNIFTFFNLLLLALAIALFIFKRYTSTFFFFIAIVNTAIGIIQEIRAKKTIDKLKLVTVQKTKVIRDKKIFSIPSDSLVLDDIYFLANGEQVPTDSLVLDGQIEVNESLLTGESLPIKKNKGDKILAGSYVVSGSSTVKAILIGDYNYISFIQSKAKEYTKPKSELVRSLNLLIKVISIIIIPIGAGIFATQWIKAASDITKTTFDIASEAVSYTAGSMVGMIPSGMYLLTSVALAVGVVSLARKKTLVQDLYCIEMLARVDTLCLDKTGTLTDGTMKVEEIVQADTSFDLKKLMGSYLNAFIENNQTSIALTKEFPLMNEYHVLSTIPFSSDRKYSSVTFEKLGSFVLGAPEYIYTKYQDKTIIKYIKEKTNKGYRVILLCHLNDPIDEKKKSLGRTIPVAIFSLEDHIRDDASSTIDWFINNNVNIKIISGDNPYTASEIAHKCHVPNAEHCISLEGLSNNEVIELVDKYTVFGRVSPEQKALIIQELKNSKHTVGMTGDGVNDILAMKSADCSIAMANGSSAARNAAHLVLLESNFSAMPAVVKEGRRVINNIQRSSALFLMKTIFTIAFSLIVLLSFINNGNGIVYPFETNNILIVELIGIGLPSFFLALQKNDQLITGHFLKNTFSQAIPGAIMMIITIGINYIFVSCDFIELNSQESFVTLCSLTLTIVSLTMVYNCCRPFNVYRSVLFISLIVIGLMLVFGLPYIPAFVSRPPSLSGEKYWNLSTELIGIDFHYMDKTMWLVLIIYGFLSFISIDKLTQISEKILSIKIKK